MSDDEDLHMELVQDRHEHGHRHDAEPAQELAYSDPALSHY